MLIKHVNRSSVVLPLIVRLQAPTTDHGSGMTASGGQESREARWIRYLCEEEHVLWLCLRECDQLFREEGARLVDALTRGQDRSRPHGESFDPRNTSVTTGSDHCAYLLEGISGQLAQLTAQLGDAFTCTHSSQAMNVAETFRAYAIIRSITSRDQKPTSQIQLTDPAHVSVSRS